MLLRLTLLCLMLPACKAEIHDVLKAAEIDAMFADARTPVMAYLRTNVAILLEARTGGPRTETPDNYDEVMFARHGAARLRLGAESYKIAAGDVINIARGSERRIEPQGGRFDYISVRIFPVGSKPPPAEGAPPQRTLHGLLSNAEIAATFARATSNQPIHFAFNYTMNYVIYNERAGPWEAHRGCMDIYFVRTGTATAQLGGDIVNGKETSPGEIRGTGVTGARSYSIGPGDVVLIPRNTPHHMEPRGGKFGYLLLKVWAE
jgi:mannose-6-phosphate isomerase-like protein (cupin superfamily)